ncbi:uncharacterized protein LOC143038268 [Oratosquilla oratoria]|uniref:uncharacterized protein LOC143038268 n=1 Tax=Oratosquilla oratoria TaxID=337810 RepID=UPI003F760CC1
MVERFHRRLKEALRAQPHPTSWADGLPIVLLNIRSTVREDLQLTPAELVYGKDLRLPSQYTPALDTHSELAFMPALRQAMRAFTPQPPKPLAASATYHHPTLMSADNVFLRVDARTGSLAPRYTGPHQVLAHAAKHVTLKIGSRHSTVSWDRVKPAHVDASAQAPITVTTLLLLLLLSCLPPSHTIHIALLIPLPLLHFTLHTQSSYTLSLNGTKQ